MNFPASRPGREAEIEHRAAEWHARRDRGLKAAEQDELFQWLAEDPRHGEWFARHRQTVDGLKLLAQWRPEHGARPNPDLLVQAPAPVRPAVRWRAWGLAGLAAAAGLALAFQFWPASDRAQRARDGAVASVAGGTTAEHPADENAPVLRRLLEDGSTIDLNRGAEVEVRFTAAERHVRLVRGEAHFTVAKNPQRPFVVAANGVNIRAVGTAFDVRLAQETVEVLVTEGRVRVDLPAVVLAAQASIAASTASTSASAPVPAPESAFVDVGERAVVSLREPGTAPKINSVAAAEIARLLAWQPRQLEFADAPLAQVVAEFNRDNRVKLVVADPILAALPIGATLRSDNVEGFVRLLEMSFGVAVERRADGVIVLRPAVASGVR